MTVLGKILVFINLVFSLLVGGLVVMVYMARTNYADKLQTSEKYRDAVIASSRSNQEKNDKQIAEINAQLVAAKAATDKLQQDLNTQIALNSDLQTKLVEAEKAQNSSAALVTKTQAEVKLRQQDVQEIRDTLQAELKKNEDLVREANLLREKATQQQLLAKNYAERLKRVETALQEKTRELVRHRANNPGGDTQQLDDPNAKNPPAEKIEGILTYYDTRDRLAKLSVGSDSGLKKGHTMELFRLNSIPEQSKYLGTLKIIEVTPKAAVAVPLDNKLNGIPQKGDQVSSRIIGS